MADLTVQIQLEGRDMASAEIHKVSAAMEETTGKAHETANAFDRIKEGFASGLGIAAGIVGFHELRDVLDSAVESAIGFNATLETAGIRLENLTGSVDGAAQSIEAVKALTEASPFEFKDMEAGIERLMRFNFTADESTKLLKVASDAAAGGAGSVDLITEAFGRMNAKQELTSRGLMSLTAAGIPVFDMLAKGLGVSTEEAEKLVKDGLIPAKEGIAILSAAIEEKFPNMAAKVSTSFDATIKNIKETFEFAAAEMGKPLFDALEIGVRDALVWLKSPDVKGALDEFGHDVADTVRDVLEWFRQLGSAMSQPEVQANLHEAWNSLISIGRTLLDLIKAFLPELANVNGLMNASTGQAASMDSTLKNLSGDIRDVTGFFADAAKRLQDLDDSLNAVKKAGDDLAVMLHNVLIVALQTVLSPVQELVDGLRMLESLASKVFHINIDIPGQAALTAFLRSIHQIDELGAADGSYTSTAPYTVYGTGQPASSAGGPGGIPNVSAGGGGAIPAPGDIAGWRAWLRPFVPTGLQGDERFLDILLTGAKAESGLDANRIQGGYSLGSGAGARGLFQFDMGGMGAPYLGNEGALLGASGAELQARGIIPEYARAYQNAPSNLSGAQLAAYVASAAERPAGAWPGGAGWNNYASNFVGDAGAGGFIGPQPVAGQAGFIGPPPADAPDLRAAIVEKEIAPTLKSVGKLIDETAKGLAKIDTKETADLGAAETKLGAGGTDERTAERAAAAKLADMDAQKIVTDDIARRKDALAQELQDDATAEAAKVAGEEMVYKRGLEDQAVAHSRELEDAKVIVDQQLADAALIHTRQLQDAQEVHAEELTAQATIHTRQLQDQQVLVSEELANAALVHQRALQDAQVAPTEQLAAQAEVHSRKLQDTEVQYQYGIALGKAKTQVEQKAVEQAHADNLTEIAHQRQLQDAESVYQQSLAAAAVVTQRKLQDEEIAYQNAQKAAQAVEQRKVADTESQYQLGLKATEMVYQRGLQDKEIEYQRGIAAEALARSRADQDKERAYARTLEDAALVHQQELAKAASDFAMAEKAKTDALTATLADEAFAREKQKVADELQARKDSIAEEFRLRQIAIVDEAQKAREAFKIEQDAKFQDQLDLAMDILKKYGDAGTPIAAKMIEDWAGVQAQIETATNDISGNEIKQQAQLNSLAFNAKANMGAGGVIPTAVDQLTDSLANKLAKAGFDMSTAAGQRLEELMPGLGAKVAAVAQSFTPAVTAADQLAAALDAIPTEIDVNILQHFNQTGDFAAASINDPSRNGGTARGSDGGSTGGFDLSTQEGRQKARDTLGSTFVVSDQGILDQSTGQIIQGFAQGGLVPGPTGTPMLAMVHGGEYVLPPGSSAVGGAPIIDYALLAQAIIHAQGTQPINVQMDGQTVARLVRARVVRTGRANLSAFGGTA